MCYMTYVLEWIDRNNEPERLILCLIRFMLRKKRLKSRHFFLQTSKQKSLDAANGRRDFQKNTCASLTITRRWRKVTIVHGPRGNASTICAHGTLEVRHNRGNGSSTQQTQHVLVEDRRNNGTHVTVI